MEWKPATSPPTKRGWYAVLQKPMDGVRPRCAYFSPACDDFPAQWTLYFVEYWMDLPKVPKEYEGLAVFGF